MPSNLCDLLSKFNQCTYVPMYVRRVVFRINKEILQKQDKSILTWNVSVVLDTLSQVRHCTDETNFPSNTSVITER